MMNKYLKIGIIVFEVALIVSLVQGIGRARKSRTRVDSMVEVKNELVVERNELLEKLEYVQGDDYLEKIAREELSLAKEGEVVVVIPEDQRVSISVNQQSAQDGSAFGVREEDEKANWEKWLEVFGVE